MVFGYVFLYRLYFSLFIVARYINRLPPGHWIKQTWSKCYSSSHDTKKLNYFVCLKQAVLTTTFRHRCLALKQEISTRLFAFFVEHTSPVTHIKQPIEFDPLPLCGTFAVVLVPRPTVSLGRKPIHAEQMQTSDGNFFIYWHWIIKHS